MYFILIVYSNSDVKVSSEKLDLCLSFIKLTIEKVHACSQVIPKIFKSFLIADLSLFKKFVN